MVINNEKGVKADGKGKVEVLYHACVSIFMKKCFSYDLMSKQKSGHHLL